MENIIFFIISDKVKTGVIRTCAEAYIKNSISAVRIFRLVVLKSILVLSAQHG